MGRMRKYTIKVMVNVVTEIIEGKTSVRMKALDLELNKGTIRRWIAGYKKTDLSTLNRGLEIVDILKNLKKWLCWNT